MAVEEEAEVEVELEDRHHYRLQYHRQYHRLEVVAAGVEKAVLVAIPQTSLPMSYLNQHPPTREPTARAQVQQALPYLHSRVRKAAR